MSDRLQVKRGTLEQLKTYVPSEGEPIWTTDLKKLYIGDGVTTLGNPIQPHLSKPMTLYVTPSGSITGSGLSWDQSLTLPAAMQRASTYSWSRLGDMTIQVGTGSYTFTGGSNKLEQWNGSPLQVIGSINDPSLTTITTTYSQSYAGTFQAACGGMLYIDGFHFSTTAPQTSENKQRALTSYQHGMMLVGRCRFSGNWESWVVSVESSYVEFVRKNIDSAGWAYNNAIYVDGRSAVVISVPTWTFVSNPIIVGAFIGANFCSTVQFSSTTTFSGAVTVQNGYKAGLGHFSPLRLNGTVLPGTSYYTTYNLTGVG